MYRVDEIKAAYLGLWGWRQNHNVSDFVIADSLTTSEIDQFYQDVHPLMTLDNVKSIAPDFENITYPTWLIDIQYRIGDRVTFQSNYYRAITDNFGSRPDTNPSDWERFDAFSEWLENKTTASISKVFRNFWDAKMADKKGKNLLESKPLFDGAGRLVDVISNDEKLVGLELVPIRATGVTVKLEKIGLQFTEAGEVTMYLMHSSRKAILQTITFTRTREGGMEWFTPTTDIYLPYLSSDIDSGGSWYLVYKQSELPGTSQAINKNKDWSQRPCASCNYAEIAAWNIWSKYLEVHPFKVSEFDDPLTMWDISKNLYTYNSNYGINLQLTIQCDLTDVFIEQKKAFQNVIGLQMGVDMLREFAYNPNFNIGREQQNFSRQEILYEIDGDSRGYKKSGLQYELDQAMKAVDIDTTQLSRVCLPCGNKGVKYRTI